MPPRIRRPPQWSQDYDEFGETLPSETSRSGPVQTRHGRRVRPPVRYESDAGSDPPQPTSQRRNQPTPAEGARRSARVRADASDPGEADSRLLESVRVQYERLWTEASESTTASEEAEEERLSGSSYHPSGSASRGSSGSMDALDMALLQEERNREDMPLGWRAGVDVQQHYVGSFNQVCQTCYAVRWRGEDETICCPNTRANDIVTVLQTLFPQAAPEPLHLLLATYPRGRDGRTFLQRIRAYNNALSFASSGISISNLGTQGVYYLQMHGSVYHLMPPLRQASGDPIYGQIYMVDGDEEQLERRQGVVGGEPLHVESLAMLQSIIREHNRLARTFRSLVQTDWFRNQHGLHRFSLSFVDGRRRDGRDRPPVALEMGMVVANEEPTEPGELRVELLGSNDTPQRVAWTSAWYDPLHFVLLYPRGERGWGVDLNKDHGVTLLTYIRYFMHMRIYPDGFEEHRKDHSLFLHGGRLFEEWILCNFSKLEWSRLDWARRNQDTLRADLYSGVQDSIAAGVTDAIDSGRIVLLPSTFQGGPRFMSEKYHDAMAVVGSRGAPSLFITMTCNPKWPEITEALPRGQHSKDRPDILCRVFWLKLKALYHEIKVRELYGRVEAIMYSIEFQKRGLPHMHMLVTLEERYRPRTVADINALVQATIPDERDDPVLHACVVSHMLHGPCGDRNPEAPCMERGRCIRKFPKEHLLHTEVDADGKVRYSRPRREPIWKDVGGGRRLAFDNKDVVPYNAYLLKRFDCHINMEVCMSSTEAVKYVFKYVFKGHDLANIRIRSPVGPRESRDEIQEYVQGRYVSSTEAYWKVAIGHIVKVWPNVERLPVHRDGEQRVVFRENQRLQNVREPITKLLAYFKFNKDVLDTFLDERHPAGTPLPGVLGLTYPEFPAVATWDSSGKVWKLRQTNTHCVGRMYKVHFSQQDKYHLWLLLKHVPGPTSFRDLKDGHETFAEACRARGLLDDDEQWHICMQEAARVGMPSQIRYYFCQILAYNEIENPLALWNAFKYCMSDDFLRREDLVQGHPQQDEGGSWSWYALAHVSSILEDELGTNTRTYNLPDVPPQFPYQPFPPQQEGLPQVHVASLNEGQKRAYDAVLEAIKSSAGGCKTFFLDGIGGSGKTYLYKCLIHTLRCEGLRVIAVASSGLAALLLPRGTTAHKRFRIPIQINADSICAINRGTGFADDILQASLIIWDEAPMMSRHVFKAVDRTLRDLTRQPNVPFGGKTVVLGGDFRQCLPVIPRAQPEEIVNAALNNIDFWDRVTILRLHENMRVRYYQDRGDADQATELQAWTDYLKRVGDDTEPILPRDHARHPAWIHVPARVAFPMDREGDFIRHIYGGYTHFDASQEQENFLCETAILCPTNLKADNINQKIINSDILGDHFARAQTRDFYAINSIVEEELRDHYPQNLLDAHEESGLPPHKLVLKVGCPIIMMRNYGRNIGVVNGTRLILTEIHEHCVKARILTGIESSWGREVLIGKVAITPTDNTRLGATIRRIQFPFRVSFAMTINKSQGLTLKRVGLHLETQVFSHGQLYVALSRVGRPSGITVFQPDHARTSDEDPLPVRNCVFTEALLRPNSNIQVADG